MSELVNSSAVPLNDSWTLLSRSPLPTVSPVPVPDPLPIILAVLCLFVLFASCAAFLALCRPSALERARNGHRESMPHHSGDTSEPQLRLWKRLGSLRQSLSSFRRTQRPPAPCRSAHNPLPCLDATEI
nr:PREDICTED: uncharacterized protein C10orf105 homolog [Lepisosteus oculatus]XP_015202148.1 PREDICTED: uncharacterized protein C10orf105 homolog [Lepisosteus oculatus]